MAETDNDDTIQATVINDLASINAVFSTLHDPEIDGRPPLRITRIITIPGFNTPNGDLTLSKLRTGSFKLQALLPQILDEQRGLWERTTAPVTNRHFVTTEREFITADEDDMKNTLLTFINPAVNGGKSRNRKSRNRKSRNRKRKSRNRKRKSRNRKSKFSVY